MFLDQFDEKKMGHILKSPASNRKSHPSASKRFHQSLAGLYWKRPILFFQFPFLFLSSCSLNLTLQCSEESP